MHLKLRTKTKERLTDLLSLVWDLFSINTYGITLTNQKDYKGI